jgi:hypothetical protein
MQVWLSSAGVFHRLWLGMDGGWLSILVAWVLSVRGGGWCALSPLLLLVSRWLSVTIVLSVAWSILWSSVVVVIVKSLFRVPCLIIPVISWCVGLSVVLGVSSVSLIIGRWVMCPSRWRSGGWLWCGCAKSLWWGWTWLRCGLARFVDCLVRWVRSLLLLWILGSRGLCCGGG